MNSVRLPPVEELKASGMSFTDAYNQGATGESCKATDRVGGN